MPAPPRTNGSLPRRRLAKRGVACAGQIQCPQPFLALAGGAAMLCAAPGAQRIPATRLAPAARLLRIGAQAPATQEPPKLP